MFTGTERYRVVRLLGEGAHGAVYEVEDRELGRRVALKELSRTEARRLYAFKQEFRRFAELRHPNLVELYELEQEGDRWFFTMQLVRDPVDWATWVRRPREEAARGEAEETLDEEELWRFEEERLGDALRQLVDGLEALHAAGFVHRDVKPSNVLVDPDGHVTLVDFGIASAAVVSEPASGQELAGTPAYMAPEQLAGSTLTGAADFYAVGTMLFEVVCGERPYAGASAIETIARKSIGPAPRLPASARVPDRLRRLVDGLLAMDPAERPGASALREALGVASAPVAPSVPPPSLHRPVGRDEELADLARALAQAAQGHSTRVLLRGESGLGKSALLECFIREIQPDVVVFAGRSNQREALPFKALDPIVDELSAWLAALPEREAERLLPRDVRGLVALFPVLGRVPVIARAPEVSLRFLSAAEERAHATLALAELLERIAARRPVALVFDDFQWADDDSLEVVQILLERKPAPPCLFVFAMRREETGSAAARMLETIQDGRAVDTRIELLPLDPGDALALARVHAGDRLDEALLARVVAGAEGNPFFLEQLVRHVLDHGGLDSDAFDVAGLVSRRRGALPERERAILDALSVGGEGLSRALLAHGVDAAPGEVADGLSHLERQGLTRAVGVRGERFEVFHDRVRESVVAELPDAALRALHGRLADAARQIDPGADGFLFRHLVAADRGLEAVPHGERAAERARATLAFDRAATLLGECVACLPPGDPERARLFERLGVVRSEAGDGEPAAEAWLAAADGRDDRVAAARLRGFAAAEYLSMGDEVRGIPLLHDQLEALELRAFRSRWAQALYVLYARVARALFRWWPPRIEGRSRDDASVEAVRVDLLLNTAGARMSSDPLWPTYAITLAFRLAQRTCGPRRVARAAIMYCAAQSGLSRDPDVWIERARRARALGPAGDPSLDVELEVGIGIAAVGLGQFGRSADLLREVVNRDRAGFEQVPGAFVRATRRWLLFLLERCGRYVELRRRADAYLATATHRGQPVSGELGRVLASIRLLTEPGATSASLLEELRGSGSLFLRVAATWAECRVHLVAGRAAVAQGLLRDLERWARPLFVLGGVRGRHRTLAIAAALARLSEEESPSPRRLRRMRRAAERLGRAPSVAYAAEAHGLLGSLARLVGDREEAVASFERARALAEAGGILHIASLAAVHLGQLRGDEALEARGREALREQGVADVARYARAFMPGVA